MPAPFFFAKVVGIHETAPCSSCFTPFVGEAVEPHGGDMQAAAQKGLS